MCVLFCALFVQWSIMVESKKGSLSRRANSNTLHCTKTSKNESEISQWRLLETSAFQLFWCMLYAIQIPLLEFCSSNFAAQILQLKFCSSNSTIQIYRWNFSMHFQPCCLMFKDLRILYDLFHHKLKCGINLVCSDPSHDSSIGSISAWYQGSPGFKSW